MKKLIITTIGILVAIISLDSCAPSVYQTKASKYPKSGGICASEKPANNTFNY